MFAVFLGLADRIGRRWTLALTGLVFAVTAGAALLGLLLSPLLALWLARPLARLFITDQGSEMIRKYQGSSIEGFASTHPGKRVLVLDRTTGKELASIPADAGTLGILLDAPRKRLYVTNREAGSVTAYDSDSYQQVASWSVPTHPNSLALDTKNNVLYVSIKNGEKDAKGSEESVARIQL